MIIDEAVRKQIERMIEEGTYGDPEMRSQVAMSLLELLGSEYEGETHHRIHARAYLTEVAEGD